MSGRILREFKMELRDKKGRFVKGNTSFWKDKHLTIESVRKRTESRNGWTPSNETKYRMSNAKIGKSRSEDTKKKISESHKGKYHTPEHNEKISKKLKGRHVSPDTEFKKEDYQNEEFKKNHIKKILQGLLKRPTSFEQKISSLCFKHNLPFVYKGNGGFLINFKNPDFVNEKEKVVIEVFYSWFKIRDYGSVENYKEFCRRKYESAGWKFIFIDELDLSHENWEEVCLNKINNIINLQEVK